MDKYTLYCCGSRGSRPVEGRRFNEYGGYTTCYVLKKEDYALIIDCGTGLYSVNSIIAECSTVDIILTHVHYDHVLGLLSLTQPQNTAITIYGNYKEWFGTGEKTFNALFQQPFWPITPKYNSVDIPEDGKTITLNNELKVSFYTADHPNNAKHVIIEYEENKLVAMFDCEDPSTMDAEFIRNCNILVYDGMYTDDEYPSRIGYGHSTWQKAVQYATQINPDRLIITHHDPDRSDEELNSFEKQSNEIYPWTDFARAGQYWEFPLNKVQIDKKDETIVTAQLSRFKQYMNDVLLDKKRLLKFETVSCYVILTFVSFFMTIVNYYTDKKVLLISTLTFGILCLINIFLTLGTNKGMDISTHIFRVEVVALIVFFYLSGIPEGFSALWALLIPFASMLIWGKKSAGILCLVLQAITMFIFWTSYGNSLLRYEYSDSFMLRFPMAFFAFMALAFALETIRQKTSDELEALRNNQKEIIADQTSELRDRNFELMNANGRLELRNRMLYKTFGNFLPDEVIRKSMQDGTGPLKGQNNYVSILKCNIRNFNEISRIMNAEDVVDMLNNHLETMTEIIQKHNGTIIDFVGDSILCVFGALDGNSNHADNALSTAFEMQNAMYAINKFNVEHKYITFDIGIGIHTGTVIMGTFGSERRMAYNAVGPNVSICSRVEHDCPGKQISITQETLNNLTMNYRILNKKAITPFGLNEDVTVYYVAS